MSKSRLYSVGRKSVVLAALLAATASGTYAARSTDASPSAQRAAETETPSPTSEFAISPAPVSETATPTPSQPLMHIGGPVWVDARPQFTRLEVLVNDVVCGESDRRSYLHDYQSYFGTAVADAEQIAGCGAPGATLRFRVDGRDANETVPWQPGVVLGQEITVGPAFSRYQGVATYMDRGEGTYTDVEPVVNGEVCGRRLNALQGESEFGYIVVVDPHELVPGCGRPGATVIIRTVIVDESGSRTPLDVVAVARWAPGAVVDVDECGRTKGGC